MAHLTYKQTPLMATRTMSFSDPRVPKCASCNCRTDLAEGTRTHTFDCPAVPKCASCNCRTDLAEGTRTHTFDCPMVPKCASCDCRTDLAAGCAFAGLLVRLAVDGAGNPVERELRAAGCGATPVRIRLHARLAVAGAAGLAMAWEAVPGADAAAWVRAPLAHHVAGVRGRVGPARNGLWAGGRGQSVPWAAAHCQ